MSMFTSAFNIQRVKAPVISIGSRLSDMIADPFRPYLYVSDYNNNSLKVLSTTTDTIVNEIWVGSHPTGIDISSDGSELYVAISGGSEIAVINLITQTLKHLIYLSARPYDVVAGRLGRLYVTTIDEDWGYPRIVDTVNRLEIGNITDGGLIYEYAIVEVSSDRNTLFIGETGLSPASLLKFDVSTDMPVMVLRNEHGAIGSMLRDMELSPDDSRIYLACGAPYYIQILNTSDFTSVGQLDTGAYPCAVTLSPNGRTAYASHAIDTDVHVFDTTTFLQMNLYSTKGEVGLLEAASDGSKLYAFVGDIFHKVYDVEVITTGPRTWTVDDDGPADFHIIQEAINAASDGDTIFVYNGTYYENVIVDKSLSLRGEDKEETIIDAGKVGTVVLITANNVTVSGFTIRNSGIEYYAGIYLDVVNHCNITNNTIANNLVGILLYYSSNNSVSGNNITANSGNGVSLYNGSSNNTVSRNNITDNGCGIWHGYSSFNTLYGNYIENNQNGILLELSNHSTISNNILLNNYFGILLSGSSENSISGNTISISYVGIFLEYTHLNESTSNIIIGNTISNNEYGIGIEECGGNTIYHNNFINNVMQAGVSLPHVNAWDNGYPSGGNYWSNHICFGNPSNGSQPYIIDANNIDHYPFQDPDGWLKVHNIDTGLNYTTIQEAIDATETLDGHIIFVEAETYSEFVVVNKMIRLIGESDVATIIDGWVDVKANNVVISGFAIGGFTAFSMGKKMYFGIRLFGATDCTVSNNTIFNTGKGIWLWNSTDNMVSDNYMMINDYGIYADESPYNTIIRNTIGGIEGVGISEYGIALYSSPNTRIIENVISTNYKEGVLIEFSPNTNVIQNTILTSREGIRISHSSNNLISQNNITLNRDYGIRAIQSHNNTISRNVIANTSTPGLLPESSPGITLQDSHFNRIIQNNLTNNYIGVAVASSVFNIVSGNNISFNEYVGIRLDYPWTNYNEVSGNIVSNNDYGIFLASSANNNTISNNYITNNNRGIYVSGISDNVFFHNNLIGNTQQVVSYDSTNLWDDGYPSGGNYWSDYSDTDFYSGPYQNETGSDGIGDTPYIIDGYNQDNYPLMKPWGPMKNVFNVTWDEEIFPVTIVSNSTVTDFNFSQPLKQISFNVTGPNGSTGFCNVTIPKELLDGDFTVLINNQPPLTLTTTENETHTSLYFTYTHTTHQVQITGTTVIGEEERVLLGTGWGWMRIAHKEYVYGPARLYKIGDTQIELVVTYEGEEHLRTWNIIIHKEYKYGERYLCYSREWGFLIVGLHRHRRWQFWYAVGRGAIAFGFPRFGRLRFMPI